jgi:ABC-type amino acid transport substrate-binding protein
VPGRRFYWGSDAVVTSTVVGADIATLGDYRLIGGGPVASEPRTVVVSADEPDAETLIAAANEALAALRADGTLATLSARRFGGVDLSVPATE